MYPFQRAREKAIELRKKLLGESFCEAVHVNNLFASNLLEQILEVGIAYVPKESTELCGADAIFRRVENYIYVRDDVSDSEKAYLIAHELGHYVLEEGNEEASIATLKSLLTAEGSPAVIKVEAYGARERQELRANVFAREFLLPRSVARKLYSDGVGPRQIAKDYNIHLEVARQQVLDAVMLPRITATIESKTPPPPSSDQLEAIKAEEVFVNVVAGPGSGKTTTLVHRVRHLIEEKCVDPSHILVLTFTNKAAFELIDRLRDAGIKRASNVWAGTFHAFGLEFLRKYHQCFGLDSDVIVADMLNSITLLNRELPRLALKFYKRVQDPYEWLPTVVKGIKRLKEELVTPEEYRKSLPKLPATSDSERLQRLDVATLYECHELALREQNLVDFVDLVSMPAKALKEDRPQYGEIADKFQYVLVDEYQDVTFAMVELIRQLGKNAKSLWVVGDIRQAIHHWRGASVHSLLRFDQTFKTQSINSKLRTYPLGFNRRSSSEIQDVVQLVGRQHVLEKTSLKLIETKATAGKSGYLPILIQCQNTSAITDAVSDYVQKMNEQGVSYCDQAILSRWNSEVRQIVERLRQNNIPVLYIGDLAQRREVKKLYCLMQLLVERTPRALVGLMHDPAVKVELKDLHLLLDSCAQNPLLQRGRWLYSLPAGLSTISQNALSNIRNLLQGQRRQSSPWSFVCDILLEKRFGYPNLTDQSIEAHAIRIALWQFAYATRTGDGENKVPTLSRFLMRQQLRQRIGETYADRELPAEVAGLDAVHVMTVHGSKGLEFEVVHVANVSANYYGQEVPGWPIDPVLTIAPPEALRSKQKDWDFEAAVERNNLLYVAVSRARRHLIMYEHEEYPHKSAPQLAVPSSAFKAIKFDKKIKENVSKTLPYSNDEVGPMAFAEFEKYVQCPLQHCYWYVLFLPQGEQLKDIAVRARWAIMEALKSYASAPYLDKEAVFAATWNKQELPAKTHDALLWRHAKDVFEVGAKVIENSKGEFAEPDTHVDGFKIKLPWVLLDLGKRGNPLIEFLQFSGSLQTSSRLWRPMLNGLQPSNFYALEMRCLLDTRSFLKVEPSRNILSTKAYKAIQQYRAGNRKPETGKHCTWCPYSTFCPTLPL